VHQYFLPILVGFFAACVLVALEFLHFNGILHRDIKPENLVFDKKGYLRMTDLGVARIWKPENSCDTSGTPGYMSPEVMCRCNHGVAIDYYAVGVIVFECMLGYRPYTGNSRQEIRDKVLSKQVQIKKKDIPPGWSPEAVDFVNQTIQRKPQNRLGNNGPEEVMNHPWFSDVDWQRVRRCEIPPPYNPVYRPEEYQDQLLGGQDATVPAETLILLRKEAIQSRDADKYRCV
jgi:serine/threonine protein kinase